jgi:DNA-binding CsgD family transcriptional regulator
MVKWVETSHGEDTKTAGKTVDTKGIALPFMPFASFRLLGLSFWQAWWMLAMCAPVVLPFGMIESFIVDPTLIVLSSTTLGYLVVVGLSRRFSPFLKKPVFLWATALCCSLGTLLMALLAQGYFGAAIELPYVLASLIFSFGNALLLIMWGELWSTLATGRVGRFLTVSYAFAFVLFFVIGALPLLVSAFCTALLPAISVIILVNARNEPRRKPASVRFDMEPLPIGKVFVALVLVSITYGFSQPVLLTTGPFPDIARQSFLLAGVGIVALVLNLLVVQPPVESLLLYRPIVPTLVCGLLLMVLLPTELIFVGGGLIIIAIYSLDMLMMLVSSDVAFRARIPVALIFGLAIFAARLGTLLGTIIYQALEPSFLRFPELSFQLLLVCAGVVVLVGTLLFKETDLQKLYRTRAPAVISNESITEKCKEVAEVCGLTTRELEVLTLLANGRSVPYICEELCIAQGTAKHHVSNIYRKLGVGDRQSLLDVIERGSLGRGAL